jgi:hypothetical protein
MANYGKNFFLIFIHCFLLLKAAMNAPRLCISHKTVLPALTSAQWCYQNAFMIVHWDIKKIYIQSAQQIFTAHI